MTTHHQKQLKAQELSLNSTTDTKGQLREKSANIAFTTNYPIPQFLKQKANHSAVQTINYHPLKNYGEDILYYTKTDRRKLLPD